MLKKIYISNRGQGLLETTIALGIIIIGLVAVLTLIIMGISSSGKTKERVIAVNLAREGIEIIRAIRDSNQLDPTKSWPFGLDYGSGERSWIVDWTITDTLKEEADFTDIDQCTNCLLYLDSEDRYRHKYLIDIPPILLTPTIFKRLVKIERVNDHEIRIISRIFWQERNQPQSIVLETVLTDWR